MRTIVLVLGLLVCASVNAREDCSLNALKLERGSDVALRLFYTGTCHYRNKEYAKSARVWQQLAELKTVKKEYQQLQVDVLNNLGYLMFFGLGIDKDQERAISYWQKAITLGQTESEYHLCHAYADKRQATYNREKARLHCKKALLIYRGMDPKDEQILSLIEKYYERVK